MKQYLIEKIKNKKGSMMLESMILLVVGILVLMGFLTFLDQGTIFARNSLGQINQMERAEDKNATLGTFRRIP